MITYDVRSERPQLGHIDLAEPPEYAVRRWAILASIQRPPRVRPGVLNETMSTIGTLLPEPLRTDNERRRLRTTFSGWSGSTHAVRQRVFEAGLVVLDANVLLALYEVGSTARDEVFAILEAMASRIWIPHQAALEFSRNRKRVVVERLSRFRSVRKTVKSAATDAIDD